MRKQSIIYIFLFVVAFFLRLYVFSISDNMWGADPDERIRIAANWLSLSTPRPLFISDLWLPLHPYFLALTIRIFNDLIIAPRIMHILIGCISLIPFYSLIKLVFDKRTAFYSTLLFIFYPLHVLCSIITLSEILFLLFLVTFLYYYFKCIATNENTFFSAAILCFILSSMVRYEGWILIPVIALHLIFSGKTKRAVIFFVSAALFPAIWIISVRMPIIYVQHTYALCAIKNVSAIDWHWVEVMIKYFSLPLIITGLFGILRSFRSKGALFLLTVSISLFLFFTYGISKNVLARNEEFSLSFSVVFIPFIIQGLLGIFDRIGSFKKEIMLASILFILLSFVNTSIGLLQRYPDYLNRMAAYLKCNLGKDDKVLLYNYYFQLNHIPVIVGFPVKRFAIANAGGDTLLCAPESINEYVDKNKPRYIVHSEKDESPLVFSNKGIVLNRIMKAGDYILYEVIYNNV